MSRRSKAFEVANFCKYGQSSYRFDANETGQLVDILLISVIRSEFFDPFVEPFQLIGEIVISQKVFLEYLRIQSFRCQRSQPIQVSLSPVVGSTVKPVVVPEAEGKYLLLYFFESEFMVIPHADKFLRLFILFRWDMYR